MVKIAKSIHANKAISPLWKDIYRPVRFTSSIRSKFKYLILLRGRLFDVKCTSSARPATTSVNWKQFKIAEVSPIMVWKMIHPEKKLVNSLKSWYKRQKIVCVQDRTRHTDLILTVWLLSTPCTSLGSQILPCFPGWLGDNSQTTSLPMSRNRPCISNWFELLIVKRELSTRKLISISEKKPRPYSISIIYSVWIKEKAWYSFCFIII